MAIKSITPVPVELNGVTYNASGAVACDPVSATTVADGFEIDASAADNKLVILFQIDSGDGVTPGTATIKAGNLIQGTVDLTVDVPVGLSACVVDSGYFKNSSKKVKVIGSASKVKCGAIILP